MAGPLRRAAVAVRLVLRGAAALVLLAPCGARGLHAEPARQAPDTMEARLAACVPCHGDQGRGTTNEYFPRLAGKPAGYLENQLVAFRDGRRRYPPMNYLLQYQTDGYLQKIAEFFAAQRPPLSARPISAAGKEVLARGQSMARQGDLQLGVPACASCHGPSFTGMEPAIPGLIGLPPGYVAAQLGAWRYGTRTAFAPDCMQIVAGHLTESDVTAVAAWLATLPIPAEPSPVPHGTLPMPFACGSEPN